MWRSSSESSWRPWEWPTPPAFLQLAFLQLAVLKLAVLKLAVLKELAGELTPLPDLLCLAKPTGNCRGTLPWASHPRRRLAASALRHKTNNLEQLRWRCSWRVQLTQELTKNLTT